eukprot:TRINITY_DN57905_c0_g1_i1.p1 TRINITY_DN57905_c0_g1~~TRINITY_DN57905_c0_g1_i1.p1  ORF type:complete len:140 (+),score=15.06 TRINITY_DN57905_c0_g1_i1:219-638(+)
MIQKVAVSHQKTSFLRTQRAYLFTTRQRNKQLQIVVQVSPVDKDEIYMEQALKLAERGVGKTYPNPAVGCVIVKNGEVVGEGYHEKAGESHAEVYALRAAGNQAEGATAYVTLAPCNHFGRTPPCSVLDDLSLHRQQYN